MKIYFNKNYLKIASFIIIPTLILFWVVTSLLFINRISFSVVTYQTRNLVDSDNYSEIYRERSYKGEFEAIDNNLGLVIVDLGNYRRPESANEYVIVFRFKEKGDSGWAIQREYDSGLFDSQSQFSFGIPVLVDSKNKYFQFEIASEKGSLENHIKIKKKSSFITGYQYSKSEILGVDLKAFNFFYSKFLGFITDLELLTKSLIYLIPLAIYILVLFFLNRIFLRVKYVNIPFTGKYLKVLLLLVLIKLLLPQDFKVSMFFILVGVWTAIVYFLKLKSSVSFLLSFTLLILWILIIPFDLSNIQKLLNVSVYIFLAFGVFQLLYEEVGRVSKK